ncbi:MAG: glycosyltransferase [Candidatus Omnitrophota bacterium]
MKKKIIIIYSTAGMGHKKAALAIYDVLKTRDDIEAETMDVLDYATKLYRFLYLDAYVFAMSRGKILWGFFYWLTNLPFVDDLTRKIRSKIDHDNFSGLGKTLIDKNADAIIATHFLVPSIAGYLKKSGVKAKLYTLMTDYGPHSYWLSEAVDKYFVGSRFAQEKMIERGVPREKIEPTGISTTEEFRRSFDVNLLKEKYNVDKSKKTIFVMSGGFGVGPIARMLLSLNVCKTDFQIIVVCGHNKKAYDKVKALGRKLKYPIIPFGFTDKVAELMVMSDIMITKAGGISTTEALNTRIPMIFFGSIPGQEAWNEKFLIESGAAKKAETLKDIAPLADEILSSPGLYDNMMKGIDGVRRPYAAKDIAEIVVREMEKTIDHRL